LLLVCYSVVIDYSCGIVDLYVDYDVYFLGKTSNAI